MKRVLLLFVFVALTAGPASAAPSACDRTCLYKVLDRYLEALKAHDPSRAPFAKGARISENNVLLAPGDGMWGTITALGGYDFRFADPKTGGVGFYGVVDEAGTTSPFALRLKIRGDRITEAESVVARPQDAGVPFVTADEKPIPELNEILPPSERTARAKMIQLVDGYFSTMQLNDGTLHTVFADDCNRREDGFLTTNHPDQKVSAYMAKGCAEQFKLGIYRYDDRLRARRYLVVDEARGLVMAAAFIDHSGRLGDYRLTDGTPNTPVYRRPHSFCLLETFRIVHGKISRVEAVFTSVPYRMPSPWLAAARRAG
jgi:hypothetical protein